MMGKCVRVEEMWQYACWTSAVGGTPVAHRLKKNMAKCPIQGVHRGILILGSVFMNYMQLNKECKEYSQLATLLCYKCCGFLQELFSN